MKNNKNMKWIIAAAVVALLLLWGVGSYNGLVGMDETVQTRWADVETQYQRRADLIPIHRQCQLQYCRNRIGYI